MTDRIQALTVTLSRDIREDDCEAIVNSIMMIKGVATVTPVVSNVSAHVARMREYQRWSEALHDMVNKLGKEPVS